LSRLEGGLYEGREGCWEEYLLNESEWRNEKVFSEEFNKP
jgi:hypothetical protein